MFFAPAYGGIWGNLHVADILYISADFGQKRVTETEISNGNHFGQKFQFSPTWNQDILISSLFYHASTGENLYDIFPMARSAANFLIFFTQN